jgi:hypothetical protein
MVLIWPRKQPTNNQLQFGLLALAFQADILA